MRHSVLQFCENRWELPAGFDAAGYGIVFAFLDPDVARNTSAFNQLKSLMPAAQIVGCTTGGEIAYAHAHVGGGFAACLGFEAVRIQIAEADIGLAGESFKVGQDLAKQFKGAHLAGVFIVSDGARVNGSALVEGFQSVLGTKVSINGGLAGDGDRFGESLVGCSNDLAPGKVVAVAFFGTDLTLRTGSFGGWEVFGPKRKITKSDGNTLFQLDHKSALELYKRYLGDEGEKLPGSALFYPLQVSNPANPDQKVVRTILGVDETTGAMTFAGDMPEGWTAQLMFGEVDGLIAGAGKAGKAASASQSTSNSANSFAILVSCIGRRLLLGQRATEEVRAVIEALDGIAHVGFYSYGEISPNGFQGTCNLHNQTMTVTVFEAA
ncbi:FIST signal transduction protein [Candidatus Phycosocius spiralis]|uniref:Uncharacterized protein n=1 Tax=Candidatus Phycosocius spiralis TaxID=2815099 RepID=A0ABQ4PUQ0_9PROT|nr:FIST N-terminal domain-containing protein [Candidatus Phycosocius spiralis]GIU66750.1 hypothetical protein PsB1_0904 [Candidatus Phycosocius spiralis]